MISTSVRLSALLSVSVVLAGLAGACSSGNDADAGDTSGGNHVVPHAGSAGAGGSAASGHAGTTAGGPGGSSGHAGGGAAGKGGGLDVGNKTIQSIAITPAGAVLDLVGGKVPTAALSVVATYSDKSSATITGGVTWSVNQLAVGGIAASGLYTPTGKQGGVVSVKASLATPAQSATTSLTVKLHVVENDPTLSPATIAGLLGASTPDPMVTWAYPYDGTAFARGLLPPKLMWNGGAPSDSYLLHVDSPTFELVRAVPASALSSAPPVSQLPFDAPSWTSFTESVVGDATFTMSRASGTTYTRLTKQSWKLASSAVEGAVYYWANNLGRVVRIAPGASTPEDFTAGIVQNPEGSSCSMTCHSVSANGNVLVSGGGAFGGSWDLKTNTAMFSLPGVWGGMSGGMPVNDGTVVQWLAPALSPDGTFAVTNSQAADLTGFKTIPAMLTTKDGMPVADSGLDAQSTFMPAFSPEGDQIAFLAGSYPAMPRDWEDMVPAPLRVVLFDPKQSPKTFGSRDVVPADDAAGSFAAKGEGMIAWPSFSPDGKWMVYQRGSSADTRGTAAKYDNRGRLYLADVKTGTEIELSALNGTGYPFAAGADRDERWSFEPTFAPVPAGGYFWVVFTSPRTYGNQLTGTPAQVKQLWVAAIDIQPTPGKDPSHAPFYLGGQDPSSLNMRGFWALTPCKTDGASCAGGSECCGGFCDTSKGAGMCRSDTSSTCAAEGDHCTSASECCDADKNVVCIAHVCTRPSPG